MTQKWNLQDIRPVEPKKKRPVMPPTAQDEPAEFDEPINLSDPIEDKTERVTIEDGNATRRRGLLYGIIAFVTIVGGAVLLSAILGKTELTVYPEHREPNINSEFTAYPDQRNDALSYEIMTLEATSESQVAASGQIQVEELATGVIEIIKTTPGAERLITNTRFRNSDGLVYRIRESVVVPGAVTDDSGATIPGTIQAEVFADDIGEEYNLPAGQEFDIPGFEESGLTELYDAISGRNPQAFTGGFNGPQFQIDDSELQTARQALQLELRDNLLLRVEAEKPSGFIAFPGAVAITYNQLPAVEYGDDLVTIREQAVLQIPLFLAGDFGSFLAEETVPVYNGESVRIEDPNALSFSYTSPTTSASTIANETSLTFDLVGRPLLVWEYDVDKLKSDLAGLPKTAVTNAIGAYPGIEGARVSITPFWQRTFPTDPEDIIVTEELREE